MEVFLFLRYEPPLRRREEGAAGRRPLAREELGGVGVGVGAAVAQNIGCFGQKPGMFLGSEQRSLFSPD